MRDIWLRTARLGFSRWTEADLPLAEALWGDPRVARYLCAAGVFAPAGIAARLRAEIETEQTRGIQYWPLFLRADGAFAGCCGLRPAAEPETLELGVHLLPACWGRGLAREAAEAVIARAFGPLGAKRLRAGHHPDNGASRRLIEGLGFRPVGAVLYAPTGRMHPTYELTPADRR